MRHRLFVLAPLAAALACSCAEVSGPPVLEGHPRNPAGAKRGARFLGLLGLLTGLTLVDSLDDESDRPRRSGFVKIDVGRPAALDGLYGGFGYAGASPYWPGGGSSINIKIPLRPGGGGDFETMALFPFPVPYPSGAGPFGSYPSHGNPSAIEPRPSIFADPIPSGSNGSGTVLADEVEPATRKNKAGTRRGTGRTKVSPPRTIRSTLRSDGEEAIGGGNEESDATEVLDGTTAAAVAQDEPTVSATEGTPGVSSTDSAPESDSLIDNASEDPESQTASLASIVQDVNYVTRPPLAATYPSYPNSLADVAAVELTSEGAVDFQPSRSDHWQDYYSSVAHDRDHHNHQHRQRDFLPIAASTVH